MLLLVDRRERRRVEEVTLELLDASADHNQQ